MKIELNFNSAIAVSLILLHLSCNKKKQEDEVRYEIIPIHTTNQDTITNFDTFIVQGTFPNIAFSDVEGYFSGSFYYGKAAIIKASDSEVLFQVPVLKNEYDSWPQSPLKVDFSMSYSSGNVRYSSSIEGKLVYKPGLKYGFSFGPEMARKGQCITLNVQNYSASDNLQVRFSGSQEWHSPVGYDSFSYNNGVGTFLGTGPVFRIPVNAVSGTLEARSNKMGLTESSLGLNILNDMPEVQAGVWTERAEYASRGPNRTNLSGGGMIGAAIFTLGNDVYFVGGHSNAPLDGIGSKEVWKFEPDYNSWLRMADFPGDPIYFASAFSIDGKGYVGTGYNQNGEVRNDFWEYNPQVNKWYRKANFPGTARAQAVGFAINNRGYIGTGASATDYYADIYSYNPQNNSWQQSGIIAQPRKEAFAVVIGNEVFIGGGRSFSGWRSDFYKYDFNNGMFLTMSDLPHSQTGSLACFSINGKGFVGAGRKTISGSLTYGSRAVYYYEPISNSWTAVPDVGNEDRSYSVGFAVNNVGYIGLGTETGGTSSLRDIWGYKE